ncbi:MAG TPA: UDP-N-acetylmuramoyl-L-alanyl-D-glutamate--2,6-diaminopimelate ligase, partial [Candidatus Aenigmarchaeota archaeon]|nr:UDP-N-acetylmuramoyl-L-alanyl-D-glutamate--2,6-diaminopimelate ligase [Candidatus Aenigmarchaeota archaeon]
MSSQQDKTESKQTSVLFKAIDAEIPEMVKNAVFNSLHYDSRKIKPGSLFVAVRGFHFDGHDYLAQALEAGATAAVVEEKDPAVKLPQIVVKDSRKAMAALASNFYKEQIDTLLLAGITGTNGKTSTAFLLQSVLNAAELPAGLIGTIAYEVGGKKIPAWNTTPEAVDTCHLLHEMARSGSRAAVLEISSHALALNRADGLAFDVAVFTNLTRDHLDFHKTEKAYFEAKAHLFSLLKKKGSAVLNIDNLFGRKLAHSISAKMVTYGFDAKADVRIQNWSGSLSGLQIELNTGAGKLSLNSKLIGAFNVFNITAAAAAGMALGLDLDRIKQGIEKLEAVPGRLQVHSLKRDVNAVIDYAHTPDALEKALQALREITPGRLIVLFGAGGDRDKGKRPLMGKAAEENADICIITTDNPRTENPQQIIGNILLGMADKSKQIVIVDRREALQYAVQIAQSGDTILIAGKGH